MSNIRAFRALSLGATICIAGLVAAACTIHLRGGDNQPGTTASLAQKTDPMSVEFERCRTISYEQKDRLAECRKIWAEKHRQFLGQNSAPPRGQARPDPAATPPASLKDQSRLPSGLFPSPMQGER